MMAKNLGEILLEQGVIDRDALDRALRLQGRRLGEILIQEQLADPVAIARALKDQARARPGRRSARLSVDAAALDAILSRIELLEDGLPVSNPALANVQASIATLRDTVEALLLEPLDTVLARARLIARQAASETGKSVEVHLSGGGLVIDRAIAEDLSDVVLHLVRNAVDHGIEAEARRVSSGKPAVGQITIEVALAAGRLILTVSDDGGGIDEEAVYEKARERGIIQTERSATDSSEIHRALFTPGFSTRSGDSALSGRGVGLDVVEATVIRLAGEVKLFSERAKGTTFRVSVPLRLARLSVLPLRIGQEWIAVAAADVLSVEQVAHAGELLRAETLFASPPSHEVAAAAASGGALKVLDRSGSAWAFEEVGSPEDVLVREVSGLVKKVRGVVGSARLSDGRSVLLLDLGELGQTPLVPAPQTCL